MKRKKILLSLGLALAAVIAGLFVFLGFYTDRLIDPYVRSLLEVTKPYGHDITYSDIRVNLIRRAILVKEVRVFPDSSLPQDTVRLDLSVKEIRLTGFSVYQMLMHKTLLIQDFIIEDPSVTLTLPHERGKAAQEVRQPKPEKKGSPLLTQIQLDQIHISGGVFYLVRQSDTLAHASHIRLLAQSISLKQNSREEPVGYTYGDITLDLSGITVAPKSGFYDMSLDRFSVIKADSTVVMQGFRMIPKYDKQQFSKKLVFQNDRFDLKIKEVKIGHIGFVRFLAGKPLEVSSLLISGLDADIYRDKNVPFDSTHFPLFYNESFLKIPVPLVIDTISVTESGIRYEELAEGHPVAGSIKLEDFTLQILNLTNQRLVDSITPRMHAVIQAKVMGEGLLNAELTLPLEGQMHNFTCSGSVGAMQLKPLNGMLEPAINIRFNGGKVDRMTFSFSATDDQSSGWMEFLYHDLDVELLRKDQGTEKGFLSKMANWVALSNNPPSGKPLKIVEIDYIRNKNKGIINYIWKTIQSGLVRTIVPLKKHQINRKQHPVGETKTPKKRRKG